MHTNVRLQNTLTGMGTLCFCMRELLEIPSLIGTGKSMSLVKRQISPTQRRKETECQSLEMPTSKAYSWGKQHGYEMVQGGARRLQDR